MRMNTDADESVRCSASGCSCVCFQPGSVQLRSCDRCGHGWVTHALEKLHFQAQQPSSCGPVEVALPGLVFNLSSLVLYGAQAIPVRLKILLDRLFSILNPEQVGHILHTLGWSLGDYVRGYMLQLPGGKVLDRWLMVTPEEELLILKQFLRFGETRPIVELMALQCLAAVNHLSNPEPDSALKNGQSETSTFIERSGGAPGALRNTRGTADVCCFKRNVPFEPDDTVHHFENVPVGHSLLPPFHFPASTFHCLAPPTKQELLPPGKLTPFLRKPGATRDEGRQDGGQRAKDGDQQPPDGDPPLKIKAEPDKLNLAPPTRRQELHLHKARQENTSSLPPSFSSSLHPSPPASSSYSLNPLPSFSSSFLCPLPTSSSSLRPLPSALCSLPPAAGGRKGRVCCGVCGKSFYDKGTLKIHYNAVHLKIKHRCTVAGCAMVFSSLRSRNRHSANPNPRLHTSAGRDAHTHRNTHSETHTNTHSNEKTHKDKSTHTNTHSTHTRVCTDTFWQQDDEAHARIRLHAKKNGCYGHTNLRHGGSEDTPPAAPPPSGPQTLNQSSTLSGSAHRSGRHPQAPPPPPLLPACSASSLDSPPSLDPLQKTERCQNLHTHQVAPAPLPGPAHRNSPPVSRDDGVTEDQRGEACVSPPTNQQQRWESSDPTPKKKSRKSSTPVKIEREKVEVKRSEEEEES